MAAAPAAISMLSAFTYGDIGKHLTPKKVRFDALRSEPMTNLLLEMIKNPGFSNLRSNLDKLHSV